jgi:hypothetical protein
MPFRPNNPTTPVTGGENIRHWSFTAFEWVVRDVHRLRDYVENGEIAPNADGGTDTASEPDDFEVLREYPILGDGKFKLEIGPPSFIARASKWWC